VTCSVKKGGGAEFEIGIFRTSCQNLFTRKNITMFYDDGLSERAMLDTCPMRHYIFFMSK